MYRLSRINTWSSFLHASRKNTSRFKTDRRLSRLSSLFFTHLFRIRSVPNSYGSYTEQSPAGQDETTLQGAFFIKLVGLMNFPRWNYGGRKEGIPTGASLLKSRLAKASEQTGY